MTELVTTLKKLFIGVIGIVLGLVGYYFVVFPHYQADFHTLSAARKLAHKMPEFPESDNTDWFNPDYSTFFRSESPTLFQKVLYQLRIKKPFWSPKSFKALLNELSQTRIQEGYINNCVQKIVPPPGTKFVIWGNLQGAFHSLVRDLEELKKQGTLDNHLHIIDPAYYFVFAGNVISRSPYSLETLTLVLQLMKMNPGQVIYIRGTHEIDQLWQDFDMHYALRIRLWWQVRRHTPLASDINQFFDTLPNALYLVGQETADDVDVVRISNKYAPPLVRKDMFGDFFSDPDLTIWPLKDKVPTTKQVNIKAKIICNFDKTNHYLTQGLRMLFPDEESTVWGVLSAPTSSYRNRFNFTNDAFVFLTTASQLDEWTLTLCKQDVDEKQGFDCSQQYNLLQGFLTTKPFRPKGELIIGSSIDLSSVFQRFGEYLEEGMQARIQDQNVAGGVNGLTLKLLVKDDAYEPVQAQENIESFMAQGIDIILAPFGTPTIEAFMDEIQEKKVLVLFPTGGTREEVLKYLIYYRVSLAAESEEIIEYALDNLKSQKIIFFFPDDEFGIKSAEAGRRVLDERGFKAYKEFPYRRNTLEFTHQTKEILEYNPDTFALFCPTLAAQAFIRQFGLNNVAGDFIIGKSGLNTHRFERFLRSNGLSVTVPAIVPNPQDATLAITAQYQESMRRHKVDINSNSFEGYIVASIFIEVLKKIKGTITKDKIVRIIEQMKDVNLGGIPLNFNPKTRQLSHTLWIAELPKQEFTEWQPVQVDE